MRRVHDQRTILLRQGDITDATTDAIVNAANQWLAGGGGVDGAIHRAGGPIIMEECRRLGGCPTGNAVATGAGKLRARHIIHAVAPVWRGGRNREADLLRSAYRRSLEIADELGDLSISFPSLGTGAYAYPVDEAATIALKTVLDYLSGSTHIDEVTFVLFSEADLTVYERSLGRLI